MVTLCQQAESYTKVTGQYIWSVKTNDARLGYAYLSSYLYLIYPIHIFQRRSCCCAQRKNNRGC